MEAVTVIVDKKNKTTTKRRDVLRNLVFRGQVLRDVRQSLARAAQTVAAAPPA